MRVLALITARGGSRRLPGKNVRPLGGKPLVRWSIDVAMGIPEICDILLSTDDATIAEIGRQAGVLVPWLRPSALATDDASSVDVALHAVDWYESEHGTVDGLMLLQPTSPFRTRKTLELGLTLFRVKARPVIAVSPAKLHPSWCFRIVGGILRRMIDGPEMPTRSQDLEPVYTVNGSFYLTSPAHLRQARSFFSNEMVPLIIEGPEESIDIDTEWDWFVAAAVQSQRK